MRYRPIQNVFRAMGSASRVQTTAYSGRGISDVHEHEHKHEHVGLRVATSTRVNETTRMTDYMRQHIDELQ